MVASKNKKSSSKLKKVKVRKLRLLDGSGSRLKSSRKKVVKKIVKKKVKLVDLKRSDRNPIIQPESDKHWKSKATFNPTAAFYDGKVHIIYRAIGESDNSVLGYGASDDGVAIKKNYPQPIYFHTTGKRNLSFPHISYVSGGGWGGGCEDPRLTILEDKAYMLYTAFDGWGSVRIAMTSISLDDFISNRFNWKEPVSISPPGQIHKNWVLFPEKIDGKYAILHSISPRIMIDYLKSLDELDGDNFIYSVHQGNPLWQTRDRLMRGVGPAPIKTKYGWLVLYHRMEKHDTHRYKLWAMILDLNDPTQILYNSSRPILEPDEWYENDGYKSGVVYSCGALVKPAEKGNELFVYYGGADKVSCVATANLDNFLKELVDSSAPTLKVKP